MRKKCADMHSRLEFHARVEYIISLRHPKTGLDRSVNFKHSNQSEEPA